MSSIFFFFKKKIQDTEAATLNVIGIFGFAGAVAVSGILAAAVLVNPSTEYMDGAGVPM